MTENKTLARRVNLFEAVATIVGMVVGASIFILVPTITGITGPSVFIAYAVAMIPCIFVVLFETQIVGALPVTGANYVALSRAVSPFWAGSLSLLAVVGFVSGMCLMAVGFGQYTVAFIQSFVPSFTLEPNILAAGVILLFALANWAGVELTAKVQAAMFLIFVAGMLIFGITGAANFNPVNMTPMFPGGAAGFIMAIVLASYSWSGLTELADIGGEVKNPRRNLPLALVISLLIILILYVLQPFALVASMNWKDVAKTGSNAIMVDANNLLPGWGNWVIYIAALGAILTTINAGIWAAPRTVTAWARDGLLPKGLAHINSKTKAPDASLLVITILILLGLATFAAIEKFAVISIILTALYQILLSVAVLRIPKKLPTLFNRSRFKLNTFWRWFVFIGTTITCVFLMLGSIAVDMMNSRGQFTNIPWAIVVFFSALPLSFIYWFLRKAYLKSKGIDLEKNMLSMYDASLAEAEERQ